MSDKYCGECGCEMAADAIACPRCGGASSFAAPPGSATWRNRPPADLAEKLCHWLHNHDRIRAMTNAELVRECLGTEAADWDVVNEMMTRLNPGWQDEPDSPEWECPICKRWYSGETASGCANGHPAAAWRKAGGEIIHKTTKRDIEAAFRLDAKAEAMWEAYGPSGIPMTFEHESSVGPTEINDVAGPLCVVGGDTDEESMANARRISALLNEHGLSPNDKS